MNRQDDDATIDLKGADPAGLFRSAKQNEPPDLAKVAITAEVLADELKDKYEQVRPMEAGGMACVFEAYHKLLKQWMVIKLPSQQYRSAEDIERFVIEAKAIYELRDEPNIVRFTEVSQVLGVPYFAMERVEGKPLSKVMSSLSEDEKLRIGIAVCEALAAVHRAKITHRDIKPDNIIITPAKQVKVIDFGIASMPEDSSGQTFAGSPGFKAPEQGSKQPVDHRADIYSLGVTLCQMFTQSLNLAPESGARLARGLVEAIAKATQFLPENRFQSMSEMAAALRKVQTKSTPPPLPENNRTKTRGHESSGQGLPPPLPRTPFRLRYRHAALAVFVLFVASSLGWENCLFGLLIFGATQFRLVAWKGRLVVAAVLGSAWIWRVNQPVAPEDATSSRPFVNSVGMEFVPVPGHFLDGKKILIAVRPTERTAFGVFTADPKQIGKYSWASIDTSLSGEHRRVTRTAFQDAQDFCAWLSNREHRHYRLPYANEWEAAVAPAKHLDGDEVFSRNRGEVYDLYDDRTTDTNSAGLEGQKSEWAEWCGDLPVDIKGALFQHMRRATTLTGDRAVIWTDLALPTYRRFSEMLVKSTSSPPPDDGLTFRCVLELGSENDTPNPMNKK